ncbi:MAG: response regulator [Deltaproteobacteria bacterium]|nr:response regulator [Deltaproteobacteria bacterium]
MPDGVKVLVVDDEEEFVDALAQRLEVRGFTVMTAFSGDDALAVVQDKPVDVVILDVLMPGKDGLQTLKEIKQLKPLVEVIMLTGHATVETGIEGMKLGAYDYLMKPTDTEELVSKINKAHGRKAEHEERISQAHINNLIKTRGW